MIWLRWKSGSKTGERNGRNRRTSQMNRWPQWDDHTDDVNNNNNNNQNNNDDNQAASILKAKTTERTSCAEQESHVRSYKIIIKITKIITILIFRAGVTLWHHLQSSYLLTLGIARWAEMRLRDWQLRAATTLLWRDQVMFCWRDFNQEIFWKYFNL